MGCGIASFPGRVSGLASSVPTCIRYKKINFGFYGSLLTLSFRGIEGTLLRDNVMVDTQRPVWLAFLDDIMSEC